MVATINKEKLLKKHRLESTFKLIDRVQNFLNHQVLNRQNGEGYLTADKLEEMFNPGRQRDIDSKFWKDVIHEFNQTGRVKYFPHKNFSYQFF